MSVGSPITDRLNRYSRQELVFRIYLGLAELRGANLACTVVPGLVGQPVFCSSLATTISDTSFVKLALYFSCLAPKGYPPFTQ